MKKRLGVEEGLRMKSRSSRKDAAQTLKVATCHSHCPFFWSPLFVATIKCGHVMVLCFQAVSEATVSH